MPLPCGQQYSHFQNSASIEEENVLRNINSVRPDVANPKIEYFCTAGKEKISSETSSHSSKDKSNLKSIHLYVYSCTLNRTHCIKQRKSKFNLALERVVQVPTSRPWNVHCPETAHKPNFQVAVVFIISRDVELGVGDVCFFLTMRCFNNAMFSNS